LVAANTGIRRQEKSDFFMQQWETLERQTVWRSVDGRYVIVETHTVQLPDGTVIEQWPWLAMPDYVNIVVETVDGRFVCFRQTKYAAGDVTFGVPGGYIEPGEDPFAAAQRELLEETGYSSPEWHFLGRYVIDGNRGAGHAHLYLARQAVWEQPIDADDLEEQEVHLLSREEMARALWNGEFRILPWAMAVSMALLKLGITDR
jgi:ADP-ribose pyrophosphatase